MTGWFARRHAARASEETAPEPPSLPPPPPAAWRQDALALEHDTPLPPELVAALHDEVAARADTVSPGWSCPVATQVRVVRDGLPDWWLSNRNLMLVGEGADIPKVAPAMLGGPPVDSLLVVGAHARCHQSSFAAPNNMIVVGDGSLLPTTTCAALGGGMILIGEATTSTFLGQLDSRNGGAILSGRDGMWAAGIRMMTDDMHTIRDATSGARLNLRGGRIVIAPHVWLCEQVILMGGTRIGTDSVVGAASIVKAAVPANCVCVGTPARIVRTGITWSREDLP